METQTNYLFIYSLADCLEIQLKFALCGTTSPGVEYHVCRLSPYCSSRGSTPA